MTAASPDFVNVGRFSTTAGVNAPNGEDIADNVKSIVEALLAAGRGNGSYKAGNTYGFLVLKPYISVRAFLEAWGRDPYSVVWFAAGDGKYIANVFRKLLAAMQGNVQDTLLLDRQGHTLQEVESVDADGRFPMGPFPYGGFLFISLAELQSGGGLSVLHQEDDPAPGAFAALYALGQLFRAGDAAIQQVLLG